MTYIEKRAPRLKPCDTISARCASKEKPQGVFSPVHAAREQGANRSTSEKEKEKRTANAIRFSLCYPNNFEPYLYSQYIIL